MKLAEMIVRIVDSGTKVTIRDEVLVVTDKNVVKYGKTIFVTPKVHEALREKKQ